MTIQKIKLAQSFNYITMTLLFLTCFFSSVTFASAGKAHVPTQVLAGPSQKIPVIIDTDMGADDWFALLYLLNRTDVDILAITIPITGETHCQAGMNNVNKLIDLSGKMANKTIPVACGQTHYTHKYVVPFPEKWRREADTLGGIVLPRSARKLLSVPAEVVIQELVEKQNELGGIKPIIVTLGPLTTLANILEKKPEFKHKIAHVISMGGAVSVKGNIHYIDPIFYQNRVSEWNYYADPLAAKKVIESGIAFKMIPLDATDTVPLSQAFMNEFKRVKKTKIAEFIYAAIHKRNEIENHAAYCFWDSLTVAIALDENMASFKSLPITIKYGEPNISGQTVVDHQNGQYIQVALEANPKRFHQNFLDVVNR